jgi:transcriptional regulator with XRE-family HTH domain
MTRSDLPNFLRAWREHRGLTQAELAEAVGTTGAVISLLESGNRGLSDKWLRKIAPVLRTRPGHLLELDPLDAASDVFEIWSDIPEENREQARNVLRAFRREGTNDQPILDNSEQPKPRGRGKGPKGV